MDRPMNAPPPCLTDDEFKVVCTRFEALGDRLCDEQMLQLADRYHEMLRQRQAIRSKHPTPARPNPIP